MEGSGYTMCGTHLEAKNTGYDPRDDESQKHDRRYIKSSTTELLCYVHHVEMGRIRGALTAGIRAQQGCCDVCWSVWKQLRRKSQVYPRHTPRKAKEVAPLPLPDLEPPSVSSFLFSVSHRPHPLMSAQLIGAAFLGIVLLLGNTRVVKRT